MRAAFTDPQGRRLWRMMPLGVPALLVALGVALGVVGVSWWWTFVVGSLFAVVSAGLVPTRQRKSREVELVCGPGYVDVTRAGTRTQRIEAKSIEGATTARRAGGFVLTLSHAERSAPLMIEVDTEAQVDEIRRALGIGHGGFGTIGWRTTRVGTATAGIVGNIILLLCGVIGLGIALAGSAEAVIIAFAAMGQLLAVGLGLAVVGWFAKSPLPSVVMAADGLRLLTPRGWFNLPYDQLIDIRVEPGRLVFVVPPPYREVTVDRARPWNSDGLSDEEARTLAAQIKTAAARARGFGAPKEDVTGRLEVLRRNGESPRDWLVRLDMAGQMLGSGTGYRGNTLDADDLWAILEDPEAEAELRAAAARILVRSGQPQARVRIDAAVAAVRDESTNKRLRIAVSDDVDGASAELAALDAQERPLQARAARPQGVRW